MLARLIPIFLISSLLFACSSSNDDDEMDNVMMPTGSTGDTSETTDNADNLDNTDNSASVTDESTLRIAIINNGHMINMQTVAQAYTDQTGVSLEWVSLEEGVLREQIQGDGISDGSQYDIINIGMQEAPIWGAEGWTQPLSFSDAYDVNDIFPTIRQGLSYEGTLYAAPFYGESSMLMYRTDLANAAAVQIFDNDSWDNIALAAAGMHNPDEGIYGACFRGRPGWGDNVALVSTMANSFGAKWFDNEFRPQLDSAEWIEAVNFYVDLLTNYGPPNSVEISFEQILSLFNDGKCGMWIDATIGSSFIELDDVAYAQSPNAGFTEGTSWLWSWAFAIPAGTPKTQEANKFIEWATSKEYVQAVANHPDFGWGSVPTGVRASTYEIAEFQEAYPATDAEIVAIESASPLATDAKPYLGIQFVSIREFPEIGTILGNEIAAALSGTKSVEDALTAAQASADTIMRDAGYY